MLIPRQLGSHLRELGKYFPIISLTGPRQAGKTTLLQQLFSDYRYVSFEDPAYRSRFDADPQDFLARYSERVIFDEAQRVPELFSYLQGLVDEDRQPGRFILSGSQNFLLIEGITQSLAGRVGIARLFPLDFAELNAAGLQKSNPWEAIINGFYPIHYQIGMPARFFYPNYLATYLERDIQAVTKGSNLSTFRRFLQFCATLVGQTVNYSYIAKRIGISAPTVKEWLSILERSYILFLLPPWYSNMGKRLVKSPKLYFADVGLAAYLLELDKQEALLKSNYRGALFENLIVADRYKQQYHQGQNPRLYFFRDSNNLEVDLVSGSAQAEHLTEIKASTTFKADLPGRLPKVAELFSGDSHLEVVYAGTEAGKLGEIAVLPWYESAPY